MTDRARVLAFIVIASSICMIVVFTAASSWLPADTGPVLGQVSICRSS